MVWECKGGEEASDAFVSFLSYLFASVNLNEYFVKRYFWILNTFESLKEPNEIGIPFSLFYFRAKVFKFSSMKNRFGEIDLNVV